MPGIREAMSRRLRSVPAGETPRVAVVGAGAGGLCMGVALRRLGVREFVIFERSDGIGGTWYDNDYPGAGIHTAVPFYSFSFHSYDFTQPHVEQAEFLRYLANLADRYNLWANMRLGSAVTRAVWDEATHSYEVFTSSGAVERFDVLVCATGLLNDPYIPDWPGIEEFRGPAFHSSRWDHSVDLTGKRIAVVGTGSTGAQVVPAIAPTVDRLYVYQRQPGWVLPKDERVYTPAERARLLHPWYRRWVRLKQALPYQTRGSMVEGTTESRTRQEKAERYIASIFKDRPDLRKLVTPEYPFGGKPTVRASDFYPALLRDNVVLVPNAVTEVTDREIVDDAGGRQEVDVIVMCTGFRATNFLSGLDVIGRGGRSIHDMWDGEPRAYLGLTVPGFPNLYMLYGPNTNGAPVIFMHERQVAFVASNLKRMIKRGVTAIEVRPKAMDYVDRIVQKQVSRTVSARHPEVHNYGRTESGRDVITWRGGLALYTVLSHTTPRISATDRRLSDKKW